MHLRRRPRFVDEYGGIVDSASRRPGPADKVGTATGIVLANHGAIVTGETMEACYQAVTFERMCRFAYDTLVAKVPARSIDPAARAASRSASRSGARRCSGTGRCGSCCRSEPSVLD